ncbi:heterokaryon incompatibility protein-domain-containing protein [Neurospora tetraspora]|uniref:Heterokaryon incompatibility protein-domain-containing protein n=1 Tax=Neurospora tetraspora TaxID=94610 RepID=A0AAE0JKV0_9PEZI|nr:heterokaryon incompatibility protein-domain-containing protein [Neurospora tetraspora]
MSTSWPSLRDATSSLLKGAGTTAQVATYVGCSHHENTRRVTIPGSSNPDVQITITVLTLENISTRDLLDAREPDPTTGLFRRQCRYCRLLCDIFDAFFIDEYMSWITETRNKMPISVGLMICEGKPLVVNCWGFTYDRHTLFSRVDLELYPDPTAALVPSPTSGNIPTMGPTGHRAETVASGACFEFIRECVAQCCIEHQNSQCQPRDIGFVPTRLLYIGKDNNDLRLRMGLPPTEDIRWAALSHCWGGGAPFKLLQGNLMTLLEKVEISDLPPTFCDGIRVARELGLQHIWIDSLCIIQDNKTDWEVESSRMGMVYSQAFVVICGASSSNPQTPFLGPREPEWLPKRFNLQIEDGQSLPIIARQRHLLAAPLEQGLLEPPYTGAWATLKRVGPLEDQLPPYPLLLPGTLGEEPPDADKWRMTVKAYTQRQLTFASDKLPAIAGAASKTPQAQRTKYLAGLWQESLLLDLLWQVMPGATHKALTYPDESGRVVPSWSWASMDRGVTWNPLQRPELLSELVTTHVDVDGQNPYGAVAGGKLIIRGHVKQCFVETSRHKNEQWVYYRNPQKNTTSKKLHFRADGQLMPQVAPSASSNIACIRRARGEEWEDEVHGQGVFLCIGRTPWMNYNYVGLVLSWSSSPNSPGCMERIGNITNVPSDWYDSGEWVTVTIV